MLKKKLVIPILFLLLLLITNIILLYPYFFKNNKKLAEDNYLYLRINKPDLDLEKKLAEKKQKCYITPLSESLLSEKLINDIRELNTFFRNDKLNYSYYYEDLNSGYSLSIDEDKEIWAASVIKAPVVIYIYDLASQGKINLDEMLTYTPAFYAGGTGVIQNHKYYSKYSIRTLASYAIKYSDNIAHRLLIKRFGMNNILNYWRQKGSTSLFENGNLYSNFNAIDGYIVMKELYNFANSNDYGKELLDFFKQAKPNFIVGNDGIEIAHKYGWGQSSLHDMAIIFDDNPYVLVVFSKRGKTSYSNFFKQVSQKIANIHMQYNEEKNNYCSNLTISDFRNK